MKLLYLFILFICLINQFGYSQIDSSRIKKIETDYYKFTLPDTSYLDSVYAYRTKAWGIIAGVGKNRNITTEFGYGIAFYGGHYWKFASLYFGNEFLYQNGKWIYAPKISLWGNGGMAFGLNLIYYTDLHKIERFVFRPEFGVGIYKFKLAYGYNITLTEKDVDDIWRYFFVEKNNISLIWFFDTKSKKTETISYRETLNHRINREIKRQNKNAP